LAFSGLLIFCFEEWANEGLKFLSGLLGAQNQSAMVIVFSVNSLLFLFPLSFSFAISALVGASIGQGNIKKAKQIMKVSLVISSIIMLIAASLIRRYSLQITSIFTQDANCAHKAS